MTLNRNHRLLLTAAVLVTADPVWAAGDAVPAVPLPAVGSKWKGLFTPAVGPPAAVSGKVTAAADGKLTLTLGGQIGMTADWAFDVNGKAMRLSGLTVTRGSLRVIDAAGRGQLGGDEIDIFASWHQSKGKVANLPVSGHIVLHPDGPPPRPSRPRKTNRIRTRPTINRSAHSRPPFRLRRLP